MSIENLPQFFNSLYECGQLDFAVFIAHKADNQYRKALRAFLCTVNINSARLCFAVLRFIDQCSFTQSENFELFYHISEAVEFFKLFGLYERTLNCVLAKFTNPSNLRNCMKKIAACTVGTINHINGYRVGNRYMEIAEYPSVHKLVSTIVQFVIQNHLEESIINAENNSYMDYFMRKCLEYHLINHDQKLRDIFFELNSLSAQDLPLGSYVRRNLTCAAGNLFEHREDDDEYREEYVAVTHFYSEAVNHYDRCTAWFLIKNSVGDSSKWADEDLIQILEGLTADAAIMQNFGDQIEAFFNNYS